MKQKLLDMVRAARAKEQSELVPCVDDLQPDEPGRWTAKDQLAHLNAWREVAIGELDAGRTGGPVPDVSTDLDVENAKFYERTHSLEAAAIVQSAARSWDRLAAALDACTEEDLAKPRGRRPKQALWELVPGNTSFHMAEHLGYWHTDMGDLAPAEAAATWGYTLHTSTFNDDRQRGVAAYNLGCFYAVRGRVGEAVRYLREGFELRPDLREWARQDPDLNPIRSRSELSRLLE